MLTKIKIALVAAVVAASSTVALANSWDLYPTYDASGKVRETVGTLQTAPVRLPSERNIIVDGGQVDPIEVDRSDRASSPYAGGGF